MEGVYAQSNSFFSLPLKKKRKKEAVVSLDNYYIIGV